MDLYFINNWSMDAAQVFRAIFLHVQMMDPLIGVTNGEIFRGSDWEVGWSSSRRTRICFVGRPSCSNGRKSADQTNHTSAASGFIIEYMCILGWCKRIPKWLVIGRVYYWLWHNIETCDASQNEQNSFHQYLYIGFECGNAMEVGSLFSAKVAWRLLFPAYSAGSNG